MKNKLIKYFNLFMENCFKNNIFPQQILLALEVPMNYFEFFNFYKKLKKFRRRRIF